MNTKPTIENGAGAATMDPAGLREMYDTLQRYAGWLDRERPSTMVRSAVQALGLAIASSADPSPSLEALDTQIARLPGGDMRKMLRDAAGQMRRALAERL
jgi:hypothetical protein